MSKPFVTPGHQAPLRMGFPKQIYGNGLPFPMGILLTQGQICVSWKGILYHWVTREAKFIDKFAQFYVNI